MTAAHVLLTAFNLKTPGREEGHRARSGWLAGRFDLFERYCLPSIAAQDSANFQWLVFFDDGTPGWARDRIAADQHIFPFTPVFTPLFDADGWARHVRAAIGPPRAGRIVVTSNLDNDDALANDYLRLVRAAAQSRWAGHSFAINAPDGYVVARDRLYRHRHLHNAFTNLVEADDDRLRTTKTIRHMALMDHVPVEQIDIGPAWVQVVHGGNVSNRIRGARIARPRAARFADRVLAEIGRVSAPRLWVDNHVLAPVRAARDTVLKAVRKYVPVDRHAR